MSLDFFLTDTPMSQASLEIKNSTSILSKYPNWRIIETYSQGDCFFSSFYRFSIKYNKNNLVIPGVTLQDLGKISEINYIYSFRLYFIKYILNCKTLLQHFNNWRPIVQQSDIDQLIAIRDKIDFASNDILHTYDILDLPILQSIRDNNLYNFKESIKNKISTSGAYSGFVEITFFQELWRETQINENISPIYNDTIFIDITNSLKLDLLNSIDIYINKGHIMPLLFLKDNAHYVALEYIQPPQVIVKPSAQPQNIVKPIHKIIGYDFDGVIHKSVQKENDIGLREATIDNLDEFIKNIFTEIINIIKKYNKLGYTQYIITARQDIGNKKRIVYDLLKQLNIDNMLSIISASPLDKWEVIQQLNIEEYYDDSSLVIRSILMHKKNLELPNLINLYLTIPENSGFHEINNIDDILDTHLINSKHLINIINTKHLININKRKYKKYKNKYLLLKNIK